MHLDSNSTLCTDRYPVRMNSLSLIITCLVLGQPPSQRALCAVHTFATALTGRFISERLFFCCRWFRSVPTYFFPCQKTCVSRMEGLGGHGWLSLHCQAARVEQSDAAPAAMKMRESWGAGSMEGNKKSCRAEEEKMRWQFSKKKPSLACIRRNTSLSPCIGRDFLRMLGCWCRSLVALQQDCPSPCSR